MLLFKSIVVVHHKDIFININTFPDKKKEKTLNNLNIPNNGIDIVQLPTEKYITNGFTTKSIRFSG